jgi:hypothetical protein
MALLGYSIYLLTLVFLVMFWRARSGRSSDELLDSSAHDHHVITAIINDHPEGGNWAEFRAWIAARAEQADTS